MQVQLPIISSAGYFLSKDKFSNPNRYPEGSITKLRTVTEFEIELYSQDGGISHLNGKSYPITKGSLLITKPGDKRQSTLHFEAIFMHFGTNNIEIKNLINSISGFHSDVGYERWAPELNEICDKFLQFDSISNIYASAKLLTLLYQIKEELNISSFTDAKPSEHSIVSHSIEYMRQNYMHPLTINNIAEHCCISVSYLHKLFLDVAHTTPNQYLLNIRLSTAKSLLATTSMPISEIALSCGFNSQAYFSDCFKKHFLISPREFRVSFRKKLPC